MKILFRLVLGTALVLSFTLRTAVAQTSFPENPNRNWDFSIWAAGATGEEHTNSFSEAQIFTAGVFVGKAMTAERGSGWRRGSFEYGFDVMPVFVHLKPQQIYGTGFDPIIFRWNSSLHAGRAAPYIELGGGAVRTTSNLPTGNTSNFNFIARAGGGIRIFTGKSQSLDIGCRWWHISNANLGADNPEFNGIHVSVGYHWFK